MLEFEFENFMALSIRLYKTCWIFSHVTSYEKLFPGKYKVKAYAFFGTFSLKSKYGHADHIVNVKISDVKPDPVMTELVLSL